jgi:choloylglycine hydrolase
MPTAACVRIFWNTNKLAKVIWRTLDLSISDKARLVFYPRGIKRDGRAEEPSARWSSKQASLVVTAFGAGASDGMNERGLAAHALYLHDTKYEPGAVGRGSPMRSGCSTSWTTSRPCPKPWTG